MSVDFENKDLYVALFSCIEIANYYDYMSDEQFDELCNILREHRNDILQWNNCNAI